jgi:hypothetical protein
MVAIRARLTREWWFVGMTTPRVKVRQVKGSDTVCSNAPGEDVYTGAELRRKGPLGVVFPRDTTGSEYRHPLRDGSD